MKKATNDDNYELLTLEEIQESIAWCNGKPRPAWMTRARDVQMQTTDDNNKGVSHG